MGWRIESGFRYRYVARIMDYMDFKVSKHPNVLDVPEAEIYTEEGPPVFSHGINEVEASPWWFVRHFGRHCQTRHARLSHERGSLWGRG